VRVKQIKMDEHIMGNLIECFFKVNKQENALQVIGVMSSLGIVPSIATHNVIINQFVKHGQFDEAFAYYAGLQAGHGVKPDELTYTPLMQASIKRGRPDEAIELFDALKRSGLQPNVQHYSLLAQARAEKNEFERAVAQLDEMAAGGVAVDDRLYFDYVKALLDRGRVREMADVCARMERVGQRLDRETGLRIVRFLDRVGTETATVRDHVESLLALVRVLHKHQFGYRPTTFLEPYLGISRHLFHSTLNSRFSHFLCLCQR
jgi:pentatricopeptide repeat protein